MHGQRRPVWLCSASAGVDTLLPYWAQQDSQTPFPRTVTKVVKLVNSPDGVAWGARCNRLCYCLFSLAQDSSIVNPRTSDLSSIRVRNRSLRTASLCYLFWTLNSMASAESLKILRSLQSRPENKVRDLTLCKYPAKALLGERN